MKQHIKKLTLKNADVEKSHQKECNQKMLTFKRQTNLYIKSVDIKNTLEK